MKNEDSVLLPPPPSPDPSLASLLLLPGYIIIWVRSIIMWRFRCCGVHVVKPRLLSLSCTDFLFSGVNDLKSELCICLVFYTLIAVSNTKQFAKYRGSLPRFWHAPGSLPILHAADASLRASDLLAHHWLLLVPNAQLEPWGFPSGSPSDLFSSALEL